MLLAIHLICCQYNMLLLDHPVFYPILVLNDAFTLFFSCREPKIFWLSVSKMDIFNITIFDPFSLLDLQLDWCITGQCQKKISDKVVQAFILSSPLLNLSVWNHKGLDFKPTTPKRIGIVTVKKFGNVNDWKICQIFILGWSFLGQK